MWRPLVAIGLMGHAEAQSRGAAHGHGSILTSDVLWGLALRVEPRLTAQEGLIEPLPERELELVSHLTGPRNQDGIAKDLSVTHNTLKTHLRSFIASSTPPELNDAVTRAIELGLL
jgi:LuxR family maltose regulon positive regulatory protein